MANVVKEIFQQPNPRSTENANKTSDRITSSKTGKETSFLIFTDPFRTEESGSKPSGAANTAEPASGKAADAAAKPGDSAPAKPGDSAPAKPGDSAPAKPGDSAPAKPADSTPSQADQSAPAKAVDSTPAKAVETAPAKPGDSGAISSGSNTQADPADFGKIMDGAKVGFWGDNHDTMAGKDAFINALKNGDLARAGVTSVGMETFPASMQGEIDKYFDPKTSPDDAAKIRADMLNHLKNEWDEPDAVNNKIMDVVDALKAYGMRMVGIEPDGVDSKAADRSKETDKINGSRDTAWNAIIQNEIKSGGKMVIFAGAGHFDGAPGTLSDMLKKEGIPTGTLRDEPGELVPLPPM